MNEEKKILLILGASSDLAIALIRTVKSEYEYILAHFNRNDQELRELQHDLKEKLILLQADFTDKEAVLGLIAQIKGKELIPTHIVHFPAARFEHMKFAKIEWELYQDSLDTALRSCVLILKDLLPIMVKRKRGKVVFMLTSCTLNIPPKYLTHYITTKYALLGLMKSLSVEYASKGIMVNGISPDMIETKFLTDIPQLLVEQNAQNSPMKRNLTVDDVIPTIQFLLSEQANCITGQNIGITGGN